MHPEALGWALGEARVNAQTVPHCHESRGAAMPNHFWDVPLAWAPCECSLWCPPSLSPHFLLLWWLWAEGWAEGW